jgi:hypothetical protein
MFLRATIHGCHPDNVDSEKIANATVTEPVPMGYVPGTYYYIGENVWTLNRNLTLQIAIILTKKAYR